MAQEPRYSAEQDERVHRDPHVLVVPWQKTLSKRPREIILPASTYSHPDLRPIRAETRVKLVTAIAKGRHWLDELIAGTVTNVEQIAATENCTVRQVNMTISLAFLRTEAGAGRSRWAPAPWRRHRKSARCAGRMVPANTRGSGSRRKRFPSMGITAPGTEFFRPETKPKFRPVSPARDQISKTVRRTGRANAALFSQSLCDRRFRGLRGGGRSRMRTGLYLREFPSKRENREFHTFNPVRRVDASKFDRANSIISRPFPVRFETGIFPFDDGNFKLVGRVLFTLRGVGIVALGWRRRRRLSVNT